jgi:hypothetical protein
VKCTVACRRTGNRLPALLACAWIAGACRAGDAADAFVLRDSAGIAIAQNTTDTAALPRWELSPQPLIDIGGGSTPEDQLFGVSSATRLSDGRIVVAEGASGRLRFYDANGSHIMDVGRRGSGPGEFRYVGQIVKLPGDTILALNSAQAILRFDPQGEYLDFRALELLGSFGPERFAESGDLLPDGSFLAHAIERADPNREPGLFRPVTGLIRVVPGHAARDTIAWIRGIEHLQVGTEWRWLAFSPNTEVAVGQDHVFTGDSESFEIRVHTLDGRLLRIIRVDVPSTPVTPEDLDRFKRGFLEMVRGQPDAGRMMPYYERTMAELPVAETMPAFGALVADAAGRLWAQAYDAFNEGPGRWFVFDGEGRLIARVETPPRLRVFEIGRDYVLGIAPDEVGVEHVVVYGFEAPDSR